MQVLGIDLEREPYTPVSNRLWLCDYECVEDSGACVAVFERLEHMTDKALGLLDIEDHVDIGAGATWVSFVHQNQTIRWVFEVDNDCLEAFEGSLQPSTAKSSLPIKPSSEPSSVWAFGRTRSWLFRRASQRCGRTSVFRHQQDGFEWGMVRVR